MLQILLEKVVNHWHFRESVSLYMSVGMYLNPSFSHPQRHYTVIINQNSMLHIDSEKQLYEVSRKHLIRLYKMQENDLQCLKTVYREQSIELESSLKNLSWLLLPNWSKLLSKYPLCTHCLLCTVLLSQCLPCWLGQGQIRGDTPPVIICPFYLRKMLAGTLPVCPAFESITPPNRLTINAHTADYISDGYLGGKHLNDSTNRHSTVTDTALCLAKTVTRREL